MSLNAFFKELKDYKIPVSPEGPEHVMFVLLYLNANRGVNPSQLCI